MTIINQIMLFQASNVLICCNNYVFRTYSALVWPIQTDAKAFLVRGGDVPQRLDICIVFCLFRYSSNFLNVVTLKILISREYVTALWKIFQISAIWKQGPLIRLVPARIIHSVSCYFSCNSKLIKEHNNVVIIYLF